MKKTVCLIMICILLCLNSWSQGRQGFVTGKITDYNTEDPLTGVNILYSTYQGVATNEQGEFSFKADTGLTYLTFTFIGYKSVSKSIYISLNDTVSLMIRMEPNINELEEVVVSVSKSEERISALTVSIATLNTTNISNNHTLNPEELLNKTPGLEILDGQASIRGGSGYSYGAGSRVMVLVDGLPALSADAGNIRWQFLPVESIDKIEIIKGASSVLYGSSALNGIINFRTVKATANPITKITAITGVYDTPKQKKWIWWNTPRTFSNISIFHAQQINNTSITAGGFYLNENGYRKDNEKMLGRINIKIDHHSQKHKSMSYGANLNAMYTNKKDFVLWQDGDSGALIQNPLTVLNLEGYAITIDPYLNLSESERLKHEFVSRFQSTINQYPNDEGNNSNAYSYYAEYRLRWQLSDQIDITGGICQTYSSVVSNFYNNHKGFNYALYSQAGYHPVTRLHFITGLRIEQYSLDGNRDAIQPVFRAGLNYQLLNYTFVRTSYGQGYRFPSIAEKHGHTAVGSVIIFPNPDVLPEKGWNLETGIKQGIRLGGWNGLFDIAGFYTQNINLIEYAFGIYVSPETGTGDYGFMAMNTENSRVYGFETELTMRKRLGEIVLNIGGGNTYIYPVEFNPNSSRSTETYLKYRSKHTVKALFTVSRKKIEAGLTGVYKSKMLNIDNVFLHPDSREIFLPGFYEYWTRHNDGYIVIDTFLSWQINIISRLSLSVKNLLNEEYMGRPGDIQPQRNFSLQYKVDF